MAEKLPHKTIKMHLFVLSNSGDECFSRSLVGRLKHMNSVKSRSFQMADGKGVLAGISQEFSADFVLIQTGRYSPGASEASIGTDDVSLESTALEISLVKPPPGKDFLPVQTMALIYKNALIAIASDGRSFSDLWEYLRGVMHSSNVNITPIKQFSKKIMEAIENNGIKSIELDGYTRPATVKGILEESANDMAGVFDSSINEEEKKMSFRVSVKFTPPRGLAAVAEMVSDALKGGSKHSNIKMNSDEFSVVITTKKGETIREDGFCYVKLAKLMEEGGFVRKYDAFEAMKGWASELIKEKEWPDVPAIE